MRYYLDTRQITGNTDVVEDFANDGGVVHEHKLLIYVSAADMALIDAVKLPSTASGTAEEKKEQLAALKLEKTGGTGKAAL